MTRQDRASGPLTRWDPARYRQDAGFVATLGEPLLDLLAPLPGERILDLGCGDGALTARLSAAGGTVVAIDSSPEQVAAARALGLDAQVGDGERLGYDAAFDAVFSNAALHWMRDPRAVLRGVRRALRPGGRFVAEMGADGNVGAIQAALRAALERRGVDFEAVNPWYFPRAEDYRALLEVAGFTVTTLSRFERPTPIGTDIVPWLAIFAQSFVAPLDADDRTRVFEEVRERLAEPLRDAAGNWTADYVRLRFRAEVPPVP